MTTLGKSEWVVLRAANHANGFQHAQYAKTGDV